MKKTFITLFIIVLSIGLSACSTNWKEGSSGISEEELFEDLNSMGSVSTSGTGSGSSLYNTLLDTEKTKIYFAKSGSSENGGLGPAHSVLSIGDFSHFSSGDEELSAYDLETAKVALIDGVDGDKKRRFVLAVTYQVRDGHSVTSIVADKGFDFDGDKLQVTFTGANGDYQVETYDVEDGVDELKSLIHLKMIIQTGDGESSVGQFSILEGFSS